MSGKFGQMFGTSGGRSDAAFENGDLGPPQPHAQAQSRYDEAPVSDPMPQMRTVLGAGCSLEGKLVCVGPTKIDGNFSGELQTDDVLIIAESATVIADLVVQEIFVGGNVKGNITAVIRVSLAPTAQVEGDIATPSLAIEEGAQVKGKVDVAPQRRPVSEPTRYAQAEEAA